MFRYTNHVCKKCFLQNDPFHKVTLNEDGVCSLCAKPAPEEARRDWDALDKRFAAHLDRVRGTRPYEGLIMMSGGKDSAYLADLLKETYGMRLLGFIIDINYEYPETFENAKTIARKLDLPYVVFRQEPEAMRRYYRFLFLMETLSEETGKALARWRESYGEPELPLFPDSIHVEGTELLFPFQYFPYRPEAMMRHVRERLQWLPIKRFSKTYIASGCRLVKLWAYMAYLNNTNSYVDFEFCNQIRNGTLSADTVRQFYEQAEIDYEELAELIAELDMAGPMKALLTPYGEKAEALLRLLP